MDSSWRPGELKKLAESPKALGNSVGAAAVFLALSLVGAEVAELEAWHLATTPNFIGEMFIQVGTVIGAFIGGRLIPRGK